MASDLGYDYICAGIASKRYCNACIQLRWYRRRRGSINATRQWITYNGVRVAVTGI